MGRNNSCARTLVRVMAVMVVVVVVVAIGVNGQSIYACWGGCYNECFLGNGTSGSQRYPCYLKCVNTCMPRTTADYERFCAVGCSLQICVPPTGGANKDNCFESCTKLCKI
ncbi:uncharacterized protein LOC111375880 [Olea europaea var. sylvestris]|uniref:Thionin-like protein n=1 Tax=Olea europaea subsp. europaea TaxID=158383 RepID=A0A8S0S343_OLEEU|nr:uncharacterized protein LOC111375880 [Olea europaea var. sylvestris]CAA2986954.1 Hypothetical predicted protein [Olea europaea subsp. europaea]